MTKTICDICGKEMPTDKFDCRSEDIKFGISSFGRFWDICDDCRTELNKWLEQRKQAKEIKQ